MTGKMLETAGNAAGVFKRLIRKDIRSTPPFRRSSAAARSASQLTDLAMRDNRSEKPACGKGCAFCCYIQTDVFAGEAFVLADAVRRMPTEQRAATENRLRENAERVAGMTLTERQHARLPCAFLNMEQQACSVYRDRPSACRRWHSLDVRKCRQDFENPPVGAPIDAPAMIAGQIVAAAYQEVSPEPVGELHQGVLMALAPDAEKRFLKSEPVFDGWAATSDGATEDEKARIISEMTSMWERLNNEHIPS